VQNLRLKTHNFEKKFGAKLKFWAPIISAVVNLQLSVDILSKNCNCYFLTHVRRRWLHGGCRLQPLGLCRFIDSFGYVYSVAVWTDKAGHIYYLSAFSERQVFLVPERLLWAQWRIRVEGGRPFLLTGCILKQVEISHKIALLCIKFWIFCERGTAFSPTSLPTLPLPYFKILDPPLVGYYYRPTELTVLIKNQWKRSPSTSLTVCHRRKVVAYFIAKLRIWQRANATKRSKLFDSCV